MQTEQSIKDLQAAEWLQKEHYRLKSEIDAHSSEYTELRQLGEEMLGRRHYASQEIEERLKQVVNANAMVKREWDLRNEWLEQVTAHMTSPHNQNR